MAGDQHGPGELAGPGAPAGIGCERRQRLGLGHRCSTRSTALDGLGGQQLHPAGVPDRLEPDVVHPDRSGP